MVQKTETFADLLYGWAFFDSLLSSPYLSHSRFQNLGAVDESAPVKAMNLSVIAVITR